MGADPITTYKSCDDAPSSLGLLGFVLVDDVFMDWLRMGFITIELTTIWENMELNTFSIRIK